MRLLFVIAQKRDSKYFQEHLKPLIDMIVAAPEFKNEQQNRIGLVFLGEKNKVHIESDGLISFQVNSASIGTIDHPGMTPGTIKEINGFVNEFRPNVIHAFERSNLVLTIEFLAVSKRIPVILSLINGPSPKNKTNIFNKIFSAILSPFGLGDSYSRNFYNNATTIFAANEIRAKLKAEELYAGDFSDSVVLEKLPTLMGFYEKILVRQKQYIKSKRFQAILKAIPTNTLQNKVRQKLPDSRETKDRKKIVVTSVVITGTALLASLITYGVVKGVSKFKHKKPQADSEKKD